MILRLDRKPTYLETTFGQLFIDGVVECQTLEDAIRDHKIQDETCIPAGRYRITLEDSRRFGPDTITIGEVVGFSFVRIHGGNTVSDTDGCIIVGDRIDREKATISGGTVRGVLKRLKDKIRAAEGEVWIEIINPKEAT